MAAGVPLVSRRELLSRQLYQPTPEADYLIRVHRRAMACRFEITLGGHDAHYVDAAREALDEITAIEAQLTIFREESPLVHVNRGAASGAVVIDSDLLQLLMLCRSLHDATERAFDVTSTPLSRCWGFMQREGALPADAAIADARSCVGMANVLLDADQKTVRFARHGVEINLGAIGKGWALDRVAGGLRARGLRNALLSAGHSSLLVIGGTSRPWPIDLTSPRLEKKIARVNLRYGSIGTSGAGEQFFELNGTRYGHVLDPRTGWPAASGLLSVSVLASHAAVADALSTAFLVGGEDLAQRYCAQNPNVMAVLTADDGSATTRIVGTFSGADVEGRVEWQ